MKELKGHNDLINKIVTEIAEKGIDESTFDDVIHTYSNADAADINNGGIESQIRAILDAEGIKNGIAELNKILSAEGITITYHDSLEQMRDEETLKCPYCGKSESIITLQEWQAVSAEDKANNATLTEHQCSHCEGRSFWL